MERRLRAPFRRHLGMESLEHRRLLATLYVDNPGDYTVTTNNVGGPGADNGDIVTWNPGAGSQHPGPVAGLTYGTNAFGTIQNAVNAASTVTTDTIRVAGGTFNELVSVNKTVNLLGNQTGVDAQAGRAGAPETIVSNGDGDFQILANNVVIDGFTLQGVVNNPSAPPFTGLGAAIWTNPAFSGTNGGHQILNNIIQGNIVGIYLNNDGTLQTAVQHNLIQNNTATGPAGQNGIYSDLGLKNALIDNNTFTGNPSSAVVITGTPGGQSNIMISCNTMPGNGNAVALYNTTASTITQNVISGSTDTQIALGGGDSNIQITQNFIQSGATQGILISDLFAVGPNSSITINRNSIQGNTTAGLEIGTGGYSGAAGSLDAEFNWWGSSTGPTIASNPGGTGDTIIDPLGQVDYVPFLPNGVDTDPVDCGFQPSIADLSITKSDTPDPAVPGSTVTYTIVVTNNGPDTQTGATVNDTFSPTFTSVSYTSVGSVGVTGNTAAGSGNINDTVTIPSGGTITYTVTGTISSAANGSLTNTATVTAPANTFETDTANNSATATTTLTPSADLSVTKSDSPDPVTAGQNLTYTIVVMNNGFSDAQSVSLTDAVPANTTFVSLATPAGWSSTTPAVGGTGTITSTIPTLAAGSGPQTFTLVVNANASAANGSTLSNTATVSTTTTDPNPQNDSDTETTTVATSADLSVTKTDSPDPVIAGNNLTYTITVSNLGSSDAQTVSLSDAVPVGTTFVSASQTSGPAFTLSSSPPVGGTGTVTFTDATLAAGATATFTLVVNVNASDPDGSTLSNTAIVTSATTDADATNNTDTETTTVNASADLSVTKTDSPDPVIAGQNLTYTVTVSNLGSSDAQTVSLSDVAPAGTTFVSATQTSGPAFTLATPPSGGTGTVSATIPTLAAGATATFTIVVKVNASDLQGSTLSNTAIVASTTTDADAANNTDTETTTVNASADLSVTKTDSPDPVIAGNNLTYTITVSNLGSSDAQTVSLSDAVPVGTTFVSASQTSGPAFTLSSAPPAGGTGTVTFTNATLAAGAAATFQIVVKANASDLQGSTISNTAVAASTTTDTNAANNSATASTTVNASADLSVTKADSPDPVVAGQNLTYTITVSNAGVSDAQGVSLSDAVPAGTTFVSATQTSGPAFILSTPVAGGTGTVTATNTTLAAGASATFQIVVKANASDLQGSTISNTAAVTSTTADSNAANNSATASTTVNAQTDVSVTKTDSPDPVIAGSNVTYTVTVSNAGSSDAQSVSLSDVVPVGTTFVSATQTSGPAFTLSTPAAGGTGTVTATNATLAAGASATFQIVVQVNSNGLSGSTIANTANVTTTTTDTNPANNSAAASTAVNVQTDLSITKTDSPDPVAAGGNLTYTIVVLNNGPSDAQTVSLADALPAGTTFVSLTGPAGWTNTTPPVGGTGSITSTRPTLAAGTGPQTFTLVVHTSPSAVNGSTLSNTASVTTTTAESDTTNNSATETTAIASSADVSVTKTDSTDPIHPGQILTYTIVVSNSGVSDAQAVSLTDALPAETTFVSFTAPAGWSNTTPAVGDVGTVTSTRPTLAAGDSATFTLVVRVDATAADGDVISNTATVATTTTDTNAANNTATETTDVVKPPLTDCDVETFNTAGNPGSVQVADDADNPGHGVLIVTGTSRNDVIVVEPRPGHSDQIRVRRNGQTISIVQASSVEHIVVFGLTGNDTIIVNATLSTPATLFGNEGNDFLYGARGNDALDGGSGNDFLFGLGGDDMLCGGDGNDHVFGGNGNDVVGGDAGNDFVFGENGDDVVLGGDGNDFLYGGNGNDRLFGQAGNDFLFGEAGNDIVVGGDGNDKLYGGAGRDLLIGGAGSDTLYGEAHDDILVAGSTIHDEDELALMSILSEWTSSRSYNDRVNNIRNGGGDNGAFVLDGTTVNDDGVADTLWGQGGQDWFLTGVRDRIRDLARNELVN